MGGCSTPISALAEIVENKLVFRGNILSIDGKEKLSIEEVVSVDNANGIGIVMAEKLLAQGADKIVAAIRNFGKNI
jgi:hydroxymethylbilane synthase